MCLVRGHISKTTHLGMWAFDWLRGECGGGVYRRLPNIISLSTGAENVNWCYWTMLANVIIHWQPWLLSDSSQEGAWNMWMYQNVSWISVQMSSESVSSRSEKQLMGKQVHPDSFKMIMWSNIQCCLEVCEPCKHGACDCCEIIQLQKHRSGGWTPMRPLVCPGDLGHMCFTWVCYLLDQFTYFCTYSAGCTHTVHSKQVHATDQHRPGIWTLIKWW